MSDDECYIQPSFVDSRKSRNGKKKDNPVEYEKKPEPQSRGIFTYIKEYKYTVMIFALVVALLIFLCYIYYNRDVPKTQPSQGQSKQPPDKPSDAERKPASENQPPIEKNRPTRPPEAKAEAPPTEQRSAPPPSPEEKKEKKAAPENTKKQLSHEQIVNTVDDDELNHYIHAGEDQKTEHKPVEKTKAKQPKKDDLDDLDDYQAVDSSRS